MTTAEDIQSKLHFIDAPDNTVAYRLDAKGLKDRAKEIVVIHNANTEPAKISLPGKGPWHLLADGKQAGIRTLKIFKSKTIEVPAQTSFILKR